MSYILAGDTSTSGIDRRQLTDPAGEERAPGGWPARLGDVGGPDVVDWGLDGAIVLAAESCPSAPPLLRTSDCSKSAPLPAR